MATGRLISLDDADALDRAVVGGKAATLATLRVAGFAVPPGLVVPVDYDVAAHIERFGEAVSVLDGSDTWAVRSSGFDEDGSYSSLAGQYQTVLEVTATDLAEAVQQCRHSGANLNRPPIPVLIQPMVEPEASGVVFTTDPVTGDRSVTLIEAVAGLGDRLVSGETEPERWRVDGGRPALSQSLGVLTESQAARLARLADEIEAHFGTPQDVEWAFEDERLIVLQARPITGHAAEPIEPDLTPPDATTWVLDGGHFPEPVSPMGSEGGKWVEEAFPIAFGEFGALVDGIRSVPIGWRVYVKVVPLGGREGRPPPWWVLAIMARLHPEFRRRSKVARIAAETRLDRLYVERWHREWKSETQQAIRTRQDIDLSALSDVELAGELDQRLELGRQTALVHFRLFVPHILAVYRFVKFCEEHLGWSADEVTRRMAHLSPGTRRQVDDLAPIAELIREDSRLLARFDDRTPSLSELRDNPDVAIALDEYLALYGPRTPALDIIEPTLQETPHLLEAQIATIVRSAPQARVSAREGLEVDAVSGDQRATYQSLLADLEAAYAVRDENVFWTVDIPIGLFRLVAIEVGHRLARRGLLDDPEHVVFLFVDEARRALLEGAEHGEVVDRRRGERAWAQTHEPVPFLGPFPSEPPDFRGLPGPTREVNEALIWLTQHDTQARHDREGLAGVGASAGAHRGPVRVVRGQVDFARVEPGDVIVAPVANPAWALLFPMAGALITETGGILSHAAILAREFGIPAVMGVQSATRLLSDGQVVSVNGTTGTIELN